MIRNPLIWTGPEVNGEKKYFAPPMAELPDVSHLSLEERLIHDVWGIRAAAYEELDKKYSSVPPTDKIFSNTGA